MKKIVGLLVIAVLASEAMGCAYAGIGMSAAGDKVVVLRQDSFLFGALRKAFVCKVTDGGLASCASNESP